jgi:hypothetical protein
LKCPSGYRPNWNSYEWVKKPNTFFIDLLIISTLSFATTSTLLFLTYSIISKFPTSFTLLPLLTLQLFIILPLISSHVPYEVTNFLSSQYPILLLSPWPSLPLFSPRQPHPYLSLLHLSSTNSLINLFPLLVFSCCLPLVHLFVIYLNFIFDPPASSALAALKKKMWRGYKALLMGGFLLVGMSVFQETTYAGKHEVSMWETMGLATWLWIIVGMVAIGVGMKETGFWLRRIGVLVGAVGLDGMGVKVKVAVVMAVQIGYTGYLGWGLYKKKTIIERVIMVINESVFMTLVSILVVWVTEDDWTKLKANVYIGIMIWNVLLLVIFSFCKYVIISCRLIG